jgi:hypothetical protein
MSSLLPVYVVALNTTLEWKRFPADQAYFRAERPSEIASHRTPFPAADGSLSGTM